MSSEVQAIGARDAVAVTKSDITIYNNGNGGKFDALWVGGAGDVVVRMISGNTRTFSGAVAGSVIPAQCDMVMSATTATLILGLRY